MLQREQTKAGKNILVDIATLQQMLSLGRASTCKVGESAGAVIRVGRRKLYNVQKIEAYLAEVDEV